MSKVKLFVKTLAYGFAVFMVLAVIFTALLQWPQNQLPLIILLFIIVTYIGYNIYEGYSLSRETVVPPDGDGRPPVVVVCPDCDSGIYQHRSSHAVDCPSCEFRTDPDYITEYGIVRFDCPDCSADIENEWATRDLVGDGPPNTLTHVSCDDCGWGWELPHE